MPDVRFIEGYAIIFAVLFAYQWRVVAFACRRLFQLRIRKLWKLRLRTLTGKLRGREPLIAD